MRKVTPKWLEALDKNGHLTPKQRRLCTYDDEDVICLALAVKDVLAAQRQYFKTRAKEDLIRSKQLEARLDRVTQDIALDFGELMTAQEFECVQAKTKAWMETR